MKPTCLALLLSALSLPALAQNPFTPSPVTAQPSTVVAANQQAETRRRYAAENARRAQRTADNRRQDLRAAQRHERLRLEAIRKQQAEQSR